jgi:hypothetical protein
MSYTLRDLLKLICEHGGRVFGDYLLHVGCHTKDGLPNENYPFKGEILVVIRPDDLRRLSVACALFGSYTAVEIPHLGVTFDFSSSGTIHHSFDVDSLTGDYSSGSLVPSSQSLLEGLKSRTINIVGPIHEDYVSRLKLDGWVFVTGTEFIVY